MSKSFKAALAAILLAGSATFVVAQSANQAPDNGQSPMPSEEQMAGHGYGGGGWWGFGGHHGRGHGEGHGMRGDWGGGKRGPGMRMMQTIDQNSDGVIADDEAAARVEGVFLAMDADNNDELTQDEFMSVRMGRGEGRNPERQAQMQERKKARFTEMDTDKNSTVSKVEFLAAGKARFTAADADKDGKVSPWEFRGMRQNMN